jgi:hypothetical protein
MGGWVMIRVGVIGGVLSRLSSNRWVRWPVPTSYKLTPYGSVNAIRVASPFESYNVPLLARPLLILIETCHYLKVFMAKP